MNPTHQTKKKTEKSQTYPETVVTSNSNKNEIFDKADKSRSMPVTNICNKSNQI